MRKIVMKTTCIVFALLVSTLAGAQAQVTGNRATAAARQPALPAPTAFSPVSRDGSSTVWERTIYQRNPDGTVVPRKSRYTELGSGLNFKDPQTGRWRPSRETIDLLPPGGAFAASATQGSHKASFPLDIAQGVISLTTPEGKQLISRPIGLFFEDDNSSALVAIVTNSAGELVGSNQVVYPNAFEGVAASIRYRYTRAGFEQDVIVQGQLPDPAALGLNPARTRLGVLTAFFDTNNPVITPGSVDATEGMSDSTLSFGGVKMTVANTAQDVGSASVTGNWDAVAYDAGNLTGGFVIGTTPGILGPKSGGRTLTDDLHNLMGKEPSNAPNTWNPLDILSYEVQNRYQPSLGAPGANYWATAPTPFSSGFTATGIGNWVGSALK
jgi:hypothetical protein